MSREERRDRRKREWAALHAALGRTRGAAEQARRESAPWAALRQRQRAEIMPLLNAWRGRMDGLRRPLSLWRLNVRRLGLLAAYGLPGLRPIVVWTRLRQAGLVALILMTWLWQRRRVILRAAALIVALGLACAAVYWLASNLSDIADAIRELLP